MSSRFTDQLNRTIELADTPTRIVSLVPSQTEFIADLGLKDELVGITKFCIRPPDLKSQSTVIGGTKDASVNKILNLKPHVVIANKEENEQKRINELGRKLPVWVSNVETLADAKDMMSRLGDLLGKPLLAQSILKSLEGSLQHFVPPGSGQRVLYLIWQLPFYTVGGDTFIHHILELAGFNNVTGSLTRYPELNQQEIEALHVDYIFLSSEPFPFGQQHKNLLAKLFPKSKLILVDGAMFSWYGSRLLHLAEYLTELKRKLT